MTIMSARGLNVTAKLTQKGKNGGTGGGQSFRGTDFGEDLGRMDTEGDDEFDV